MIRCRPSRLFVLLVSLWLGAVCLLPVGAQKPAPKAAADEVPHVAATNSKELHAHIGQNCVVTGTVDRVGKSAAGHRFINFTGNDELTVFIAAGDVAKFKAGAPETLFEAKTISVCGKLERFKGKLQIQVRVPEMISLAHQERGPPPAAAAPEKRPDPVELSSAGRDAWVSPAGLKYAGRDPDGLTRRDHILRHARDLPDRAGSHGVFDGGDDLTFAWIDAAWKKIEQDKLKPVLEGDRITYTVAMGRRVGYLGGKSGAERNHPPLTRIFLVLRKGTTEVVTAFPK